MRVSVHAAQHNAWAPRRARLWGDSGPNLIGDDGPIYRDIRVPSRKPMPPAETYLWFRTPLDLYDFPGGMTLIRFVCLKHGVSADDLLSDRRSKATCFARHHAFYLMHTHTLMSASAIGRRMGGRDHTTVLHGIKRYKQRLAAETRNGDVH